MTTLHRLITTLLSYTITLTCFAVEYKSPLFSLQTTPTWKEYSLKSSKIQFLKEKWAWAYSFTLKSKNPVKLTHLTLQWSGEHIENLSASLYQKKERENIVIPIQKNLVCDGVWNPKKQQLTFPINEKIIAINKYHLFLSFPNQAEHKLKNGIFKIADSKTTRVGQPLKIAAR